MSTKKKRTKLLEGIPEDEFRKVAEEDLKLLHAYALARLICRTNTKMLEKYK